jgi:bifunctional DNA-binding transcriptional regulator/antitoxin component of YhaV-PrlF toxin-antitoxin module
MSSLVGTKGQITLEKEIRDALGVQPGWRALQRRDGQRVILEFLPPKHHRSLAGILADATTVVVPQDEFEAVVEQAWAEDACEAFQASE